MNIMDNLNTSYPPFVTKALNKAVLQAMFNLTRFIENNMPTQAQLETMSEAQFNNAAANMEALEFLRSDYAACKGRYKDEYKEDFVAYERGQTQPQTKMSREELAKRLAKMNRDEHKPALDAASGAARNTDYADSVK